jgi:hypothetical protein
VVKGTSSKILERSPRTQRRISVKNSDGTRKSKVKEIKASEFRDQQMIATMSGGL